MWIKISLSSAAACGGNRREGETRRQPPEVCVPDLPPLAIELPRPGGASAPRALPLRGALVLLLRLVLAVVLLMLLLHMGFVVLLCPVVLIPPLRRRDLAPSGAGLGIRRPPPLRLYFPAARAVSAAGSGGRVRISQHRNESLNNGTYRYVMMSMKLLLCAFVVALTIERLEGSHTNAPMFGKFKWAQDIENLYITGAPAHEGVHADRCIGSVCTKYPLYRA